MAQLVKRSFPKEMDKDKFEAFLEQIKRDFPADQFPELIVQYQEINGKVLILGLGEERECAEQTARALEQDPSLKKNEFKLKILREPRTKFLLR